MASLLPRAFGWVRRLPEQLAAILRGPALVLGLCLCLALTACSGSAGGLSGNYVDDTVSVATSLLGNGMAGQIGNFLFNLIGTP